MDERSKPYLTRKAAEIVALLDLHYPTDVKCYLNYYEEKPWQLLIATILSAQCTDAQVNMVTDTLFAKYDTLEDLAGADIGQLEQDIHPTGFFRQKAKSIQHTSRLLLSDYGGKLPGEMAELLKLPGVGRKTANLVLGHIFQIPSIVVDTHVKRVSNRLGLASHNNPDKIEFELMDVLPQENWIAYNTQIIAHGRAVCVARGPRCERCVLTEQCDFVKGDAAK